MSANEQLPLTQPTNNAIPATHGQPRQAHEASHAHGCRCGARWGGAKTSHCAECHATFTVASDFDRHRRGGICNPPAEATR